jgi:hypothetical protein
MVVSCRNDRLLADRSGSRVYQLTTPSLVWQAVVHNNLVVSVSSGSQPSRRRSWPTTLTHNASIQSEESANSVSRAARAGIFLIAGRIQLRESGLKVNGKRGNRGCFLDARAATVDDFVDAKAPNFRAFLLKARAPLGASA